MAIGKKEWIEAALVALAKEGVAGVKVEALARKLKVTKGSFYWHFTDRPDLLESLLAEWEAETDKLMEEARRERTAEGRLRHFIEAVRSTDGRIPDAAIFMWARQDKKVAARVHRTERSRVSFLIATLEGMNLSPEEAEVRAELAYLAFVGMSDRVSRDPDWRPRRAYLMDQLMHTFLEAPEGVSFAPAGDLEGGSA